MAEEYDDVVDTNVEDTPEDLLSGDEISPEEEGFMKGYEEASDSEEEGEESEDDDTDEMEEEE